MTKRTNIILALQQLDNLESLIQTFDYQEYLMSKVWKMRYELKRQLSIINAEVTCDI